MQSRYPIPGAISKYPDLARQFTYAMDNIPQRGDCTDCAARRQIEGEFLQRAKARDDIERPVKRLA